MFVDDLWSHTGKGLTSWLSFVMLFPIGILVQVWCLFVSIPDLCPLSYFHIFEENERCVKIDERQNTLHSSVRV